MSLLKESKMKPFAIAIVCLVLIAGVSGCKRSAAFDPGADGPAAYQITLKGTANPSTLFIPHNQPEVQSVITVRAIHNDGSPVVGREVYLTRDTELGYFGNYRGSVVRETNSNGEVQVLYIVPAGTVLPADITMYIEARIQDDTRLDNPASEIYDFIPMKVMPAEYQKSIILCGKVMLADKSGIENAVVILSDSVTGWPIVQMTRPSGSWCAEVDYGWRGTVTASVSGLSFQPTSYTFGENNPATQSRSDLDFYASTLAALSTTSDQLTFQTSGGAQEVTVNSVPYGVQITFKASSSTEGASDNWLTFDLINDKTPGTIRISALENMGNIRQGTITITSTSHPQVSPIQITVVQDGIL